MNVGGIDHDWIRTRLGWPLVGDEPMTVHSVSHAEGEMGTVDRVGCAGRSFIYKGPPDQLSAWGSLLADIGAREVQTYRLLQSRGRSAVKISPECHWSTFTGDGRGALALEDLGAPPPLPGTMAAGLSRPEVLAALRCLAAAHAAFADRPAGPFTPPFSWLYTAMSDGLVNAVRMGLDELPELAQSRWPGRFDPRALQTFAGVDVAETLGHAYAGYGFAALCHGDAWPGNILFVPARASEQPSAYVVDWQFAMWGNPLSDVAMLLMSSLSPDAQAAWHDELVEYYHRELASHGTVGVTLADCHDAYRRAAPGAALVALATLGGFTRGMSPAELAAFAPRVSAAIDVAATAAEGPDSDHREPTVTSDRYT